MYLLNSPWSATNHRRQHNVTVNQVHNRICYELGWYRDQLVPIGMSFFMFKEEIKWKMNY